MYKVGLRGQHTVPTTKLFINNKMVESQATEWVDLHNPATNEVLFFFLFKLLHMNSLPGSYIMSFTFTSARNPSSQSHSGWNGNCCRSSQSSLPYLVEIIHPHPATGHASLPAHHQKQHGTQKASPSSCQSSPYTHCMLYRNCWQPTSQKSRERPWSMPRETSSEDSVRPSTDHRPAPHMTVFFYCVFPTEVVENCCGITHLQLGETMHGIARDMDTFSYRVPLGVCAGITPFNFPAMIPLWVRSLASKPQRPASNTATRLLTLQHLPTDCRCTPSPSPAATPTSSSPPREIPARAWCWSRCCVKPAHPTASSTSSTELTTRSTSSATTPTSKPSHSSDPIKPSVANWFFVFFHVSRLCIVFQNLIGWFQGQYIYERGAAGGKRIQSNMGAKNHGVIMADANKENTLNQLVTTLTRAYISFPRSYRRHS